MVEIKIMIALKLAKLIIGLLQKGGGRLSGNIFRSFVITGRLEVRRIYLDYLDHTFVFGNLMVR